MICKFSTLYYINTVFTFFLCFFSKSILIRLFNSLYCFYSKLKFMSLFDNLQQNIYT
jgi:hypothetical protein